jgi:hypothetical protein
MIGKIQSRTGRDSISAKGAEARILAYSKESVVDREVPSTAMPASKRLFRNAFAA